MKLTPIRSEEDHKLMLVRAASLMSKTDKRSVDELGVLQLLIERWEREYVPIPAPAPLEAIRFRMKQGGLKPRDLEPMIGSKSRVYEVLSGARPLSLDMIRALHHHLGIPAASLIGHDPVTAARPPRPSKAAIDKLRTLKVMKAREDIDAFVARTLPRDAASALLRKTRTARTNAKTDTAALEAWCGAVLTIADPLDVQHRMVRPESGRELARLSVRENGPRLAPKLLADMGVALVVFEHLPGTYLDGAALRRADGIPVIALTLRHDRIDNFWFTLLHEFAHVCFHLEGETSMIFDDLEVGTSSIIEEEADAFSRDALIPPPIWKNAATADLTPSDVVRIAADAQVHPAIIAGRWQREFGDYRRFSKLLGRGEVRNHFWL